MNRAPLPEGFLFGQRQRHAHRSRIIDRYTSLLVENAGRQKALLDRLGLYGPAEE